MPAPARRALLTRFFHHAPTFPPANLPPAEALAEDRRARESEHAWMLGRLVWPARAVAELPQDEHRALAVVEAGPQTADAAPDAPFGVGVPIERQDDAVYLERVPLD